MVLFHVSLGAFFSPCFHIEIKSLTLVFLRINFHLPITLKLVLWVSFDMRTRKAFSPVIATLILVGVSFVISSGVYQFSRETAFSNVNVHAIEFTYIRCSVDESHLNAKWNIEFEIVNRGTTAEMISNIYVCDREVDGYGIVGGEPLPDTKSCSVNLPQEGVNLKPGEGFTVNVFIGKGLYSSGTLVKISLNMINQVVQERYIKLT